MPSAARERILDAASAAFYRHGIRAVGVDAVVESAGVAKATLYRHFRSKDELVEAFLLRRDLRWRAWLEQAVERLASSPADRPLAVFDALGEWFASDGFRGCAFINATAEITDPAHPAREAVREHTRALREYLERLVGEAGWPEPRLRAATLLLLVQGCIVSALIEGDPGPARRARAAARCLSSAVPPDHPEEP